MTNELWGVQGKIAYDFDKIGMELTGSYRSVDFNQVNASSDGIDYPGRNLATEQYDNFSGNFWQTKSQSEVFELRVFAKKGQRFRWNLGAFYFNEDQQVGYLAWPIVVIAVIPAPNSRCPMCAARAMRSMPTAPMTWPIACVFWAASAIPRKASRATASAATGR
jgi:hypothetical protein